MSTWYMDYENGLDATTATPYGWWSVAVTVTGGSSPVAGDKMTGQTSAKVAYLTVTPGAWAGVVTCYFYGRSGTFVAENVTYGNEGGGPGTGTGSIAGDLTYCAWKTITNGATAARIAPGDTIRIAKSLAPILISGGDCSWTGVTNVGGVVTGTKTINAATNASPIEITTITNHGYITGDIVQIIGNTVNTAANGAWVITYVSDTKFTLDNSVGNGVGGAGTSRLVNVKAVKLTTAQTTTIDRCEVAWTVDNTSTVTRTAVTTQAKEGGACMKITKATYAINTLYAHKTITSVDLSSKQKITFWIYNSAATLATHWVIKLCSDTAGVTAVDTFTLPAIPSINVWVPLTLTRDGGGNLSGAGGGPTNIQSIALYTGSVVPTAASYLYLDNFEAATSTGLNLQSLISKNSTEQDGDEAWYAIQSINGRVVLLETDPSTKPDSIIERGYSGDTEIVPTYTRETIKTTLSTSLTASVQEIQESGTSGNNIQYQGGYDTNTNLQTGETFFDGLNGLGRGLFSTSKDYITLNYLNFYRYNYGTYLLSCDYWNFQNINNCSNNGSGGGYWSSFTNGIGSLGFFNNNGGIGLDFNSSSQGNLFTLLKGVSNNTSYGLMINASDNNDFSLISNLNNNSYGLYSINSAARNNIHTITNANYNSTSGIFIQSITEDVFNTITQANYNGQYGLQISTVSLNNKVYSITTTGNGTNGIYVAVGPNYVSNALCAEGLPSAPITTALNYRVYFPKWGQAIDSHYFFTDAAIVNTVTTDPERHTATGIAWKMAITGSSRNSWYPLKLSIAKVAVLNSGLVTARVWVKKTHATNISAKLFIQGNQLSGVPEDLIATKADDVNYEELTLTFTPSETGVIEIECWSNTASIVDSVYADDFTVTQA